MRRASMASEGAPGRGQTRSRAWRRAALTLPVVLGGASGARADFIWNGSIDDLFTTGGNWVGGVAPAGAVADLIVFGDEGGGGNYSITGQDSPLTDVRGLLFSGAQGSYTIDGTGSFTFREGTFIVNDSTFAQTINVDLVALGVAGFTIQAANASLTIGGDIDLSDGGASRVDIDGDEDTTITGLISAAGGQVFKFGRGTLTLNNANTYGGGTSLDSGTIVLGNDLALGTGRLTVTGAGTITSDDDARAIANDITIDGSLGVDGANDLQLSGDIDGFGSFSKSGSGTLLLDGTNTYAGATLVREGLLQVAGGNAIGDDSRVVLVNEAGAELELLDDETVRGLDGGGDSGGNVNLNGNTLTIDLATNSTYDGEIRGTGGLILTGDQRLRLRSRNTYQGGTTISGDGLTLALGHDEALGTGDLTITTNATVAGISGERVIANDIVFSGTRLTLDGGSGGIRFDGAVDLSGNDRTFRVTNAGDVEFSGVISNGGLTKTGSGLLILSGANTYADDTIVKSGELRLLGTLAGSAQVNDGGLLTGDGRIGGDLSVRSGGQLAPGVDAIDTLTIDGDYDQRRGSTLLVEINAKRNEADFLDISGTARLAADSTISIDLSGSSFITAGQTFAIIEADGGVTDEGAIIDVQSATLKFELVRAAGFENGDPIYAIQAIREAGAFSDPADPGNNTAVGEAIDSLVDLANADPDGAVADFLALLDPLNDQQYNQALSEIDPARYNTVTLFEIENATEFTETWSRYSTIRRITLAKALHRQQATPAPGALASLGSDPRLVASAIAAAQEEEGGTNGHWADETGRFGVYARGFGFFSELDTRGERIGYDGTSYGGQLGFDIAMRRDFIGGIAVGYTSSSADFDDDDLGSFDIETLRVGPYLAWGEASGFFFDLSVLGGFNDYDVDRDMPTLGLEANGDYDGFDIVTYAGAGIRWEINNRWTLIPAASVQYVYFDYDGFDEEGAGAANLSIDDRDTDSFRTRLGLTISYFMTERSFLDVRVGWQEEWIESDDLDARFVAGGNAFEVNTGGRDETAIFLGFGVNTPLADAGKWYLRYEGAFGDDGDTHSFAGGVSLQF